MKLNLTPGLIFSLSIVIFGCDLKKSHQTSLRPNGPKKNLIQTTSKDEVTREVTIVKRTANHQLIEREILLQNVHKRWDERIEKYFLDKGESVLNKYRNIKEEHLKELAELFKKKKLSAETSYNVHMKYQIKLRKELGKEIHDGYLENLKKENASNAESGISLKLYI